MSFSIILQRNMSPLNKVGKNIYTINTFWGELRNETDILSPEIFIEATMNDLKYANYLTIQEFARKYFIEEIVSVRDGMFKISAHVDVLDTFAGLIKENTAVVLRQENNFNMLLNDGVFKCQQNPRITQRDFPSGLGAYNYILITGGSKS